MDLLTYLNINRLDYKIMYYSYLKLFVTDVNLVFYRYNINSKIYILNNIYYLLFIKSIANFKTPFPSQRP